MTESGYYPAGAEFDPSAPWNEEEPKYRSVAVDVTLTLHKKVMIDINENNLREEYSKRHGRTLRYQGVDLDQEVHAQVVLPHEAHFYVQGNTDKGKQAIEDLRGWDVDEFNTELI